MKTKPFKQVRIDDELYKDLQAIAKEMDRSTANLINYILKQAVNSTKIAKGEG